MHHLKNLGVKCEEMRCAKINYFGFIKVINFYYLPLELMKKISFFISLN